MSLRTRHSIHAVEVSGLSSITAKLYEDSADLFPGANPVGRLGLRPCRIRGMGKGRRYGAIQNPGTGGQKKERNEGVCVFASMFAVGEPGSPERRIAGWPHGSSHEYIAWRNPS